MYMKWCHNCRNESIYWSYSSYGNYSASTTWYVASAELPSYPQITTCGVSCTMSTICFQQIPYTWNFLWHVYFTDEHETRIFAVEIMQMKVIQKFRVICALLQGYVRKIYATNLSEIDKTLYQIAYHSQGNPRPPCGKSWESLLLPVGQSKWRTDNITMNY